MLTTTGRHARFMQQPLPRPAVPHGGRVPRATVREFHARLLSSRGWDGCCPTATRCSRRTTSSTARRFAAVDRRSHHSREGPHDRRQACVLPGPFGAARRRHGVPAEELAVITVANRREDWSLARARPAISRYDLKHGGSESPGRRIPPNHYGVACRNRVGPVRVPPAG